MFSSFKPAVLLFAALCLGMAPPAAAKGGKTPAPEKRAEKKSEAPPTVDSFTLARALAATYTHNPDLEAARAALRAVDEQYAQAMAGFRPSLSGTAGYTSRNSTGSDATRAASDAKSLGLTATQNLYGGGGTVAGVRLADNTIKAARAGLTQTEQTVLLAAVTAYMDVLRDKQIVDLNLNNEEVLRSHLDAARAQFRLGSITRTDVSQSEARLAAATAARIAAEGTLKSSRAAFEKTVGGAPDGLVRPALEVALPGTLEEALLESLARHPLLLQAQYTAAAASDSTRAAEAGLLPSLDLTGGVSRTFDPAGAADDYLDDATATVQLTVPLYAGGGATHALIRQSKQTESQRRREVDSAVRSVREGVISAWETLAAANAGNAAQKAQVRAEELAREGVRTEAQYGSRTTLDYLDAEQEYLSAAVALVTSEHDRVVATYGLLAAVGTLSAEDLKLDIPLYDKARNFQSVKDRWIGTAIDSVK